MTSVSVFVDPIRRVCQRRVRFDPAAITTWPTHKCTYTPKAPNHRRYHPYSTPYVAVLISLPRPRHILEYVVPDLLEPGAHLAQLLKWVLRGRVDVRVACVKVRCSVVWEEPI